MRKLQKVNIYFCKKLLLINSACHFSTGTELFQCKKSATGRLSDAGRSVTGEGSMYKSTGLPDKICSTAQHNRMAEKKLPFQ